MFIKAWYYIQDGGDGSASLRLFVDEERAQSIFEAAEGEDATHSYSDGSIQEIILNTDDFEKVLLMPTYDQYNKEKGPESDFDRWFADQYWPNEHKNRWSSIWTELEENGIEHIEDLMEDIASVARIQFQK